MVSDDCVSTVQPLLQPVPARGEGAGAEDQL
jgi:hypothetical protein